MQSAREKCLLEREEGDVYPSLLFFHEDCPMKYQLSFISSFLKNLFGSFVSSEYGPYHILCFTLLQSFLRIMCYIGLLGDPSNGFSFDHWELLPVTCQREPSGLQ